MSEEDTSKETSIPITTSQNKKIADLFGIKSEAPPVSNEKSNAPQIKIKTTARSLEESKINTLPKETSKIASDSINALPKENNTKLTSNSTVTHVPEKSQKRPPYKSLFDDSDDVMSNLTEKTKPVSEQAKKSSLMENLFGGLTNKSSFDSRKNVELPVTQSKAELQSVKLNPSSNFNLTTKSESLLSSQSTTNIGYSPTTVVTASRELRRGRRPSTGISDPLGLLGSDQKSDVNYLFKLVQN